jgi:transposase-like protein
MNVTNDDNASAGKKKRRVLSPEKKFQIFLESQSGKGPVGEILRREGIYSTDLVRIREKVKEGALERLADRPGAKRKTVPQEDYEALKRELEEKERALAEQAVELAILRKKTNGGSWER